MKGLWHRVWGLGFRIHRVYEGLRVKGAGMIYRGNPSHQKSLVVFQKAPSSSGDPNLQGLVVKGRTVYFWLFGFPGRDYLNGGCPSFFRGPVVYFL